MYIVTCISDGVIIRPNYDGTNTMNWVGEMLIHLLHGKSLVPRRYADRTWYGGVYLKCNMDVSLPGGLAHAVSVLRRPGPWHAEAGYTLVP